MESITQNKRYCPHEITTKIHSVETYRKTGDISYICRKYKISKASLMRWNKQYDGTRESLLPKSHKPHTKHPNAHTDQELKWICNYHRRNPNISICELYGKLREDKAYSRHPGSLYRVFVRLGFRKQVESTKKKSRHNGHYDTPTQIGIKWQMDVKYIPTACYAGVDEERFYQYTMIDEASRERFIYPFKEASSYSTVEFVKRSIIYFGYAPNEIQTDNGAEFTYFKNTNRVHALDKLCTELHINHKLIRPRTPWHNGKVERSHRSDQERFYNFLSFYSYDDLLVQMKRYLKRSNNIPMTILGWKSPLQKRQELEVFSA
ncbi:MAG TPA: DDE-type integrase/transposase/recombinase [Oscillospiraceae bacterium]|nr:DDE-type integrase/transposase/recombinase [Oscillospiraceae bacterium]